jgi:transcriptional regulator with XRE-family HTH domain
MDDFAGLLIAAREKARLTQAFVAQAAGLTPSYLSFIENRKKPPPSDDVCRRLAEVLGLPARKLVEVAHLERAPETVRRRVKSLHHTLRRERRSRRRVLESLLSPFLFRGPPGYIDSALDAVGINKRRQKRIREVLAAVGRRHQDRAMKVARIVEDLPERDRLALLEALPGLLKKGKEPPTADAPPPVFSVPPAAEALPAGPYLLACGADLAASAPEGELRAGDWLLVDAAVAARAGDLVVLRGEAGALVRRVVRDGDTFDQVGLGTVLEVRRPLRRSES